MTLKYDSLDCVLTRRAEERGTDTARTLPRTFSAPPCGDGSEIATNSRIVRIVLQSIFRGV